MVDFFYKIGILIFSPFDELKCLSLHLRITKIDEEPLLMSILMGNIICHVSVSKTLHVLIGVCRKM